MDREELFIRFLFLLKPYLPADFAAAVDEGEEEISPFASFKAIGMDDETVAVFAKTAAAAFGAQLDADKRYIGISQLFDDIMTSADL